MNYLRASFNNTLHGLNEILRLSKILIKLSSRNLRDFAMGNLLLQRKEQVHHISIFVVDKASLHQLALDHFRQMRRSRRDFAMMHQCGVRAIDNCPVQVKSRLHDLTLRVVQCRRSSCEIQPDTFFAWANLALEKQVLNWLKES